MRRKIQKLSVAIFILIFLGNVKVFGLESEQIKLPQQNKKIYTASENKVGEVGRNYWLKVKLKPIVISEKVYWQNKKKINWQEEIKNWQFGFLPKSEDLPPVILYKENFYPREEKYGERFHWMSNNGVVSVINLLEIPIRVDISFEAVSLKKERDLGIWINGRRKFFLKVPANKEEDSFSSFILKNVILNPGENRILFYTPQGT